MKVKGRSLPPCNLHFHTASRVPSHLWGQDCSQVVRPVGWVGWFRVTEFGTDSQPRAAAFLN